MKKLMISIFALAAMVSCTSEEEIIDNGSKVEIKLNAAVSGMTKAAIDSDFSTDLDAYFVRADAETTTEAANLTWSSSALYAKIAATAGHAISFYSDKDRLTSTPQYYDTGNKNTYLIGYYLGNATPSEIDASSKSLTFTIDGSQDIMVTSMATGSKTSKFSSLEFQHKLSQLVFSVAAQSDAVNDVKDIYGTITKIEVLDQITDLKLTFGETPVIAPKDATPTKGTVKTADMTQELTETQTVLLNTLMVYADTELGKTATPLKIKVYTSNFTSGLEVNVVIGDGTTGLTAAKKHTIELTFSKTAIAPKATVVAWEKGDDGKGNVNF